jgi:ElaB/YqjD/DUF883 family membrane-anchored ribosome-binding protein
MEIASIVSSIASVIIGGFAIWLSVTFYKLSNKIAEDTKEAAKGISASVDRLQSLFDKLYADTFTIMKDTVSDMRKHMWPDKETSPEAITEISKNADAKIAELRAQVTKEVTNVLQQVGKTDKKVEGLEHKIIDVMDKTIRRARQVEMEAQEEYSFSEIFGRIVDFLRRYDSIAIGRLLTYHSFRNYPENAVMKAIELLINENVIKSDGPISKYATRIGLVAERISKPSGN